MLFKNKRNKNDATDTVLEKCNGRAVKYVSCRDADGVEIILGKNGRIAANEREIAVICDGHDVFCCNRIGASVSELLSLEGIRIEGVVEGERKSVTAFYTYYRK